MTNELAILSGMNLYIFQCVCINIACFILQACDAAQGDCQVGAQDSPDV